MELRRIIDGFLFPLLDCNSRIYTVNEREESPLLLRQMKYFAAVVDQNSFTEAAEQCYISQSAISQQIKALEKELGVELLYRENRSFSLTAAGEYFYRQSKGILEEIEAMQRETVRIGQEDESRLRIGYLRSYSGLELHQAVAEFSQIYPEVPITIVNGTHEELYDLLRFGKTDLVLTDQRRAFSDEYINYQLLQCGCYAEVSLRNPISGKEHIELEELKHTPCILISSKEQQKEEEDYYKNTLGIGSSFLFAESLEEGRLMVAGNRGFLPVEEAGSLPPEGPAVRRVPITRNGRRMQRNYCVFWKKDQTNYYMEEFAEILRKLLLDKEV